MKIQSTLDDILIDNGIYIRNYRSLLENLNKATSKSESHHKKEEKLRKKLFLAVKQRDDIYKISMKEISIYLFQHEIELFFYF